MIFEKKFLKSLQNYQPIDENSSSRVLELLEDELWSSLLPEAGCGPSSSSVERSTVPDSSRIFLNITRESQDIGINSYNSEQHMAYIYYCVLILLHMYKVDIQTFLQLPLFLKPMDGLKNVQRFTLFVLSVYLVKSLNDGMRRGKVTLEKKTKKYEKENSVVNKQKKKKYLMHI